jgi:hypothetical protein
MDAHRIPFTEEDEQRIASAATWGSIVAVTTIATGGIALVLTLSAGVSFANSVVAIASLSALLPTVVSIAINVWLLQASAAFRKVAQTDHADQAYLLQGFRKLRGYFMVQVIMILLVLAFVLFGLLQSC